MTLIINGKTYDACELIAYVENLEKENAELKEKIEHRNCVDCSNHHSNIKLLKARKIIEKVAEMYRYSPRVEEIIEQAEQFIKEQKING